jgi:transposase InsO family protein
MIYARGTMGAGAQGSDLWAFSLDGSQKSFPYISGPGDQMDAQFSPDGHFIAYQSNENGNPEIYLAAFPWTGAKWQVSTNGGTSPRWNRDGRELFFVYGEQFMSAGVNKAGSGLEISQPRPLFRLNVAVGEQASRYAVTGDGKRFAVLVQGQNSSPLVGLQLHQAWECGEQLQRFLIFDRDAKFSADVVSTVKALGSQPIRTGYRSPWQNGVAERWVGSLRRDLLDYMIVLNQSHLRRLLNEYVRYYNWVPYCPTSLCC